MKNYCLTCNTNFLDRNICIKCGDDLISGSEVVRYFAESFVWKGRTIDDYRTSIDPADNELVGLWIDTDNKRTRFIRVRFDTIKKIIAKPTKEFTTACVCTKGHFKELVSTKTFRAVCVKITGEIRTFYAERLTANNYTPVEGGKKRKPSKSSHQILINEFAGNSTQVRTIDVRNLLLLIIDGKSFRGLHTI